jgi:hypothetical protein
LVEDVTEQVEHATQRVEDTQESLVGQHPTTRDDDPVFGEHPFRAPEEERTPGQVYRDLSELAWTHLGMKYEIDNQSIERGTVRASDLSMFEYNSHGYPDGQRTLGRVEVTGFRADAVHSETGEAQSVIALSSCMNMPVPEEDADIEFIPDEQIQVDPLLGTTAEIVAVSDPLAAEASVLDGEIRELTLQHEELGRFAVTVPTAA